MKLLVIMRKEFAGCGFYRLYQPHNHLAKFHDAEVLITDTIRQFSDEKLSEFDIAIWHKSYFDYAEIDRCKSLGVVTIADFDDHWLLPKDHIFYASYVKDNTSSKLHRLIIRVDHVTCTTELLADEIYEHNHNVHVLPNAMDMNYPGCKVERVKEDKFIFGYLGGHTHVHDVRQLRGLQASLLSEKAYQLRLFGYDQTSVYNEYADILSDNRKGNFSVYKGADIWNYPQFYNYMDCLLVPLLDTTFNSMKSELKMIEAGFFKKAVIVSDVEPYQWLIKDGENCLAVKHREDWTKHCKTLLNNRSLAEDLGNQLYQDVQKYSIENVNKKRIKLYRNVLKNRHINGSRGAGRVVKLISK